MHTDAKRYYALLDLDPACSDEDIRGAFRRRAKELHPDAQSGNATAFIRLKRAYDILSDPARRARYDRASNASVRRAMRPAFAPPPPRARSRRSGGVSFMRYFVAFLLMGGLSFGVIEAMISYADVPPAGAPHPASLVAADAREAAKGDAAIGSGFWDSSSPDGTPRNAADDRTLLRKRPSGLASE